MPITSEHLREAPYIGMLFIALEVVCAVLAVLVRTTEACERYATAVYPLQVVRMRRYDGPVVFVERRERAEGCARD